MLSRGGRGICLLESARAPSAPRRVKWRRHVSALSAAAAIPSCTGLPGEAPDEQGRKKSWAHWSAGLLACAVTGLGTRTQQSRRSLCTQATASEDDSSSLWLEEVQGKEALNWVTAENERTVATLGDPTRTEAYRRILAILDSNEKIPHVARIGKWYYNFWQDDVHVKGIWRRTTLESYKTAAPEWRTVLDLDALAEQDAVSWVWSGYEVLNEGPKSTWDRVLISLSPGGSDAVVVREFDLESCKFIPQEDGGFYLSEAKSGVSYKSRDEVFVGTDFGEGSLTNSGYPRLSKVWKRGTPLEEAVLVFEGEAEDICADQSLYHDRGHWHELRYRVLDFYTTKKWYRPASSPETGDVNGEFIEVKIPEDASLGTFADAAIITLRSDWEVEGASYKSGSMLSLLLSDCVRGDFSNIQVLFTPSERVSLQEVASTRHYMVISLLDNVRSALQYWHYEGGGQWKRSNDMEAAPVEVGCKVAVSAVWPVDSDDIWMVRDGFLEPDALRIASAADCAATQATLKAKPTMFNAKGLDVEQFEAQSLDGTKIPYFVVRQPNLQSSPQPTLLDGYGGFEISMTPFYSGGVGAAWLEKGGVYVVANIRGGGEFGPVWHQAALRSRRHKACEDFEAVGRDLVDRGITVPDRLACIGGSNGGLLVGNMLTREGANLFGAAVCQVPLLDMQRYHKLLAGASWVAEYGDPEKSEDWAYLRSNSPYHRVHDVCLPSPQWRCPQVLFTTSTKDDRVHPGHARRMVHRLHNEVPKDRAPVVLYWENAEGGHGGAAHNKQIAYMWALTYDFLWQTIGAAEQGKKLAICDVRPLAEDTPQRSKL